MMRLVGRPTIVAVRGPEPKDHEVDRLGAGRQSSRFSRGNGLQFGFSGHGIGHKLPGSRYMPTATGFTKTGNLIFRLDYPHVVQKIVGFDDFQAVDGIAHSTVHDRFGHIPQRPPDPNAVRRRAFHAKPSSKDEKLARE